MTLIIRLAAHLKLRAGRPGFEVSISDSFCHNENAVLCPILSNLRGLINVNKFER